MLKQEALTGKISGVLYEVNNELGHRFLECFGEELLMIALREAGVQAEEQVPVPVLFRCYKTRGPSWGLVPR